MRTLRRVSHVSSNVFTFAPPTSRVDIYVFSGDMGGKYFAKSMTVRPAHEMAFEHWTYRFLHSQGKLCVYGD